MADSSNRTLVTLLLGVAAGAAIGYYLNSEKGQEHLAEAGDKLGELKNDLTKEIETKYNSVRDELNSTLATLKGKAVNVLDEAEDAAANGKKKVQTV